MWETYRERQMFPCSYEGGAASVSTGKSGAHRHGPPSAGTAWLSLFSIAAWAIQAQHPGERRGGEIANQAILLKTKY